MRNPDRDSKFSYPVSPSTGSKYVRKIHRSKYLNIEDEYDEIGMLNVLLQ